MIETEDETWIDGREKSKRGEDVKKKIESNENKTIETAEKEREKKKKIKREEIEKGETENAEKEKRQSPMRKNEGET